MATLTTTTFIDAPPREVFDAFTNLDEAAHAINDITNFERLTPGPTRRGTRFRETRIFLGRKVTEEMEISDFEPDADVPSYTVRGESCGTRFDSTFRFIAEGEGTRVEVTVITTPMTFAAKLFSPLGRLMMGSVRKCIEKDTADLKRVIERGTLVGVS